MQTYMCTRGQRRSAAALGVGGGERSCSSGDPHTMRLLQHGVTREGDVPSGQAVPQVGALWAAFQMAFQLFLALSKDPGVHLPGRAQLLPPDFAGTEQPRTEPPRSPRRLPRALSNRRAPLAPGPSTGPFLQLFPFQSRHTPSPSGDFPFPTLSSGQQDIAPLTLHSQPPYYQEKIPASKFFPI